MMASLVKAVQLSKLCKANSAVLCTAVRHHWNKDYKPGPYPVTQEQRDAAAKKYGVLPSEYECYPDDGVGYGDYPKVPLVSGEAKDPYYPYDFPEHKRNFNEPIHVEADMIGEDRFDVTGQKNLRFTVPNMFLTFFGVMAGFYALYYTLENIRMFRPVLPKQYPKDGVKHYSFPSTD